MLTHGGGGWGVKILEQSSDVSQPLHTHSLCLLIGSPWTYRRASISAARNNDCLSLRYFLHDPPPQMNLAIISSIIFYVRPSQT